MFVGTGDLANFHEAAASLAQKNGHEIDAGWVTLGQLNVSAPTGEPVPIPVGNAMEDALEGVALAMNTIARTASSVQFPAISLTPNSIYRIS